MLFNALQNVCLSQIVHPKSDAQRKSLLEAVKGILLFRSLEKEQLGEVLDAMFYREVTNGDYIIHQGDDGDNFYVIERYSPSDIEKEQGFFIANGKSV